MQGQGLTYPIAGWLGASKTTIWASRFEQSILPFCASAKQENASFWKSTRFFGYVELWGCWNLTWRVKNLWLFHLVSTMYHDYLWPPLFFFLSFRLTAFVALVFHQAKEFITVDDTVIDRALIFVMEQQNPDGSFNVVGTVHHDDLMVGALMYEHVELTPFLNAITLIHSQMYSQRHPRDQLWRRDVLCEYREIPKLECFLSFLRQSIDTRCKVGNEDVVGAVPTGDVPSTSDW